MLKFWPQHSVVTGSIIPKGTKCSIYEYWGKLGWSNPQKLFSIKLPALILVFRFFNFSNLSLLRKYKNTLRSLQKLCLQLFYHTNTTWIVNWMFVNCTNNIYYVLGFACDSACMSVSYCRKKLPPFPQSQIKVFPCPISLKSVQVFRREHNRHT